MTTLPYLRDELSINIPTLLVLDGGGKAMPSQITGEDQYMYFFMDGEDNKFIHFADAEERDIIALFEKGDTIQVVRKEKKREGKKPYFTFEWTPPEGAEAGAAASPPEQTRQHKVNLAKVRNAETQKDVCICLQGYAQRWILSRFNEEGLSENEVITRSHAYAKKARQKLIDMAQAILESDTV